jgi:hypothetical protein
VLEELDVSPVLGRLDVSLEGLDVVAIFGGGGS